MKKKLAMVFGVVAIASFGLGSASAEDVCTPIGCAGTYGDGAYADGDASNPDPLDGYITVTSDGVCADDNGAPGDSASPTCAP